MALFKCKMCGGDLNITADEKIIECEFCGTTQTIPTSKDENLQGLFNRANILRMKSEFDKAEQLYLKKNSLYIRMLFLQLSQERFGTRYKRLYE